MENTALLLIVISLFLLVLITGLLSVLIFKLFKDRPSQVYLASNEKLQKNQIETQHLNLHPQIVDRLKELEKIKPKKSELFCPHHVNEPGEVGCAICDHMFCSACIRPFKSMYFCKEHIQLIMRHDWGEVLTIKTSTTDPEEGVRLYEVKKEFFENENLPTYIETHYKINIDQDYIETYLVLYAIKEKVIELKEKLKVFIP